MDEFGHASYGPTWWTRDESDNNIGLCQRPAGSRLQTFRPFGGLFAVWHEEFPLLFIALVPCLATYWLCYSTHLLIQIDVLRLWVGLCCYQQPPKLNCNTYLWALLLRLHGHGAKKDRVARSICDAPNVHFTVTELLTIFLLLTCISLRRALILFH